MTIKRSVHSMAAVLATVLTAFAQTRPSTETMRPPVTQGPWVRPDDAENAAPVWGHVDGLRVGLAPLPGPRGLVRIYTPYLGQSSATIMNFLAVEPIVAGQTQRGFSEMEQSPLDHCQGKRFTAMNAPGDTTTAKPARGIVETIDGQPALRVFVDVEPFDNGAHVYLRLTFRADRPHAVGVAAFAYRDSKPLDQCIVTATMGNYARLRDLHLASRTVSAAALWPDFSGTNFTDHASFGLSEMKRDESGSAIVTATPNEASPKDAVFGPKGGWRYDGLPAAQSWICPNPDPALHVLVNGRTTYWAILAPIPGGVAFENFELNAPFKQGAELWFAIEPLAK